MRQAVKKNEGCAREFARIASVAKKAADIRKITPNMVQSAIGMGIIDAKNVGGNVRKFCQTAPDKKKRAVADMIWRNAEQMIARIS